MSVDALVDYPGHRVNETVPVSYAPVRPMDLAISERAVNRILEVVDFTKKVMTTGTDYGKIPGTDKPTLLKPGAEKLCAAFNVTPSYEIMPSSVVDWDVGFFNYDIRCVLKYGEQRVGEGIGSCNSREKKYRYRWYFENEIKGNEDFASLNIQALPTKKTAKGYVMYRVDNMEPHDVANTILKMASKRALVAACLTTFGLSGHFSQDLEDMSERLRADLVKADRLNPDGEEVNKSRGQAKARKPQTPVEPKRASNEPPPPDDEFGGPRRPVAPAEKKADIPPTTAQPGPGVIVKFLDAYWKHLEGIKTDDRCVERAKGLLTAQFPEYPDMNAAPPSLLDDVRTYCKGEMMIELESQGMIPEVRR